MSYCIKIQLKIEELWDEIGCIEDNALRRAMVNTFRELLRLEGEFSERGGHLERYIRAFVKATATGIPEAGQYGL